MVLYFVCVFVCHFKSDTYLNGQRRGREVSVSSSGASFLALKVLEKCVFVSSPNTYLFDVGVRVHAIWK